MAHGERIIIGPGCLAEGAAWLAHADPRLRPALMADLPLRLRPDGFGALLDAIIGQQVSVASARAIMARLEAAGFTDRAGLAAAEEAGLRACGLSRQKIRYSLALARSDLDFEALRRMTTAQVVATLTALPGIGPWTAEIYAMFALGRADVFAPADLALQVAARHLLGLPARPKERDLRKIAESWSPWRSVAARALWSYYRLVTSREGIG